MTLPYKGFVPVPDYVTVANLKDVPPGSMRCVRIGRKRVAIYNVDGKIYATDDTCTHEEASLTEGELFGDIVECPLHGAAFNVCSGEVEAFPAVVPIQTYKVLLMDGEIQVSREPND